MLSDLVIPSVEQCSIIIFLVKEKPAEILCRLNAQYGEETAVCNVNIGHLRELILGNWWITVHDIASNSGVLEALRQLPTLIVQESVCPVCPKNVNIWPEGTACCCVCRTSALVCVGGKHVPGVNSDLWQIMGALFHSRVKAVQHGMASQEIFTTQKFMTQLLAGKHHGTCVLGFRRSDSCWFCSTWCNN
jgi:hypothetical protein